VTGARAVGTADQRADGKERARTGQYLPSPQFDIAPIYPSRSTWTGIR